MEANGILRGGRPQPVEAEAVQTRPISGGIAVDARNRMTVSIAFVFLAGFAVCSMAQEPPPEPPPAWTGSVGAGLGLTSGNSDTKNFNLSFLAVYDPKTKNLFKTEGFYLWGQADGETNVDKGGIGFRYERKLTDCAYFFAELPYLRDRFKGITYLIAPAVGVGIKAVKNEKVELDLSAGAGAAFEKDEGFEATSSGAVSAAEALTWKISQSATFTQKLTGLWKTDDWSDAFYHFEIAVAAGLTKRTELKVAALADYKNKPVTPDMEKTDTALIAALVMKF
jgi:putative salt-induced outer membrane protein YdiY